MSNEVMCEERCPPSGMTKRLVMDMRPHQAFRISVMLVTLVFAGCATTTRQAKPATQSSLAIVEQYVAALNRRDLLALTAYVAPDVEWYSVVDDERILEVTGREALTQTLQRYFAQNQQTHWSIEHATVVDRRVAVRERSQWHSSDGQNGERVSLSVYELRDGRIARISYFLDTQ
jgi:ketosteroid isomerase-like protein